MIFLVIQDAALLVVEKRDERPAHPVTMNAFELISKSQGLNLSSLFEKQMVCLTFLNFFIGLYFFFKDCKIFMLLSHGSQFLLVFLSDYLNISDHILRVK